MTSATRAYDLVIAETPPREPDDEVNPYPQRPWATVAAMKAA